MSLQPGSLQPGALRDAIEQHIAAAGFECVDVTLGSEAGRRILRIILDRLHDDPESVDSKSSDSDGGFALDACATVSRSLGALLEEIEGLPEGYVLEVTSPGINRALLTPAHYRRFRGERVKIKLRERLDGARTLIGILGELQEGVLEVQSPEATHRIPLEGIASANLHCDFDEILRRAKRDAQ
jgi:ribosome maturation factor RimP